MNINNNVDNLKYTNLFYLKFKCSNNSSIALILITCFFNYIIIQLYNCQVIKILIT